MSKLVEPKAVMKFLNQLFTVFDQMIDMFGVQKVETAGGTGFSLIQNNIISFILKKHEVSLIT